MPFTQAVLEALVLTNDTSLAQVQECLKVKVASFLIGSIEAVAQPRSAMADAIIGMMTGKRHLHIQRSRTSLCIRLYLPKPIHKQTPHSHSAIGLECKTDPKNWLPILRRMN